jgi:hypothetical protein
MGATGMGTKTLISKKAMQRHLDFIHKGVSATTWESSDLRFDDKCNHLGVTP